MISYHNICRMCRLAAAVLVLAGCTDDPSDAGASAQVAFNAVLDETAVSKAAFPVSAMLPEGGTHDTLYLTATSEPLAMETLTRGQLTTIGQFEAYGQFALFMRQDEEAVWKAGNLCYSHQGNGIWTSSSAPDWPRTGTVSFYAFAPYGSAAVLPQTDDVVLGASESGGTLSPFVINSVNAQQCDLLVASNKGLSGKFFLPVPLRFQHALTAVQFVMADDIMPGTVKGITIKNVRNAGTYSYKDGEWTTNGSTGTFNLSFEKAVAPNQGGASITGALYYFWMMPQNLGSGSTVELAFDDGNGVQTYSCPLSGVPAWQQGHLVTYTVSTTTLKNQYTLELQLAEAGEETLPYQGGDVPALKVKSNRNSTTAVPWTLQYSYDQVHWFDSKAGETGSDTWIAEFDGASGMGHATDYQIIPAGTLKAGALPHLLQPGRSYTFGSDKGTTSAAPFDLSTGAAYANGILGSTANCYIVDAPGWYCFPLVYGNAVLDGMVLQDAFNFEPANILVASSADVFLQADGGTCQVLWDQNYGAGLSDLSLMGGNRYVRFQVRPQMEDNVLIAIRSSTGDVLWSWHIWVKEPGTATATVTSLTSSVDYGFLAENLGQVDGSGTLKYGTGGSFNGDRKLYLRATSMKGTVRSDVLELTQQPESIALNTSSLKYQFGRKDPFYDGQLLSAGDAAGNILDLIRYPATWRYASTDAIWYTTAYDTWWTGKTFTDNLAAATVKTIFDPCPAGFKVPEADAFCSFSLSNSTPAGSGSVKGLKFKNKAGDTDDKLLFMFHQYTMAEGALAGSADNPTDGYYWSAMRYDASKGFCWHITSSSVDLGNNVSRARGCSIRPVAYEPGNQMGILVDVKEDQPEDKETRPIDPPIVSE